VTTLTPSDDEEAVKQSNHMKRKRFLQLAMGGSGWGELQTPKEKDLETTEDIEMLKLKIMK
jgi:hypothetical protein